ncbi:MAG: [FeFe] hydrogenase H-cluster radical SAM maturase HydE [Bacteroidia bacterium]|nr:[FeFe] hydrogenase H-cluster radical SAM maturase HydE [Bacteroidia bacterium]
MTNITGSILSQEKLSDSDILVLLSSGMEDRNKMYIKSAAIRDTYVGNKVFLRGLIEFSNICSKNCLYCGIRAGNTNVHRYNLEDEEVLEAAMYAFENHFGSIVLQSGERDDRIFTDRVDSLVKRIKNLSGGKLGITLSMGEQTEETYRRWFESGAHRYLLRIETSNPDLYRRIHPDNAKHNYKERLDSLINIKKIGYQVGTGVMIGLPFQTMEDLVSDLRFMQNFDIDMVGMGPYIEHVDTPLYQYRDTLLPLDERFNLTMKMIALIRILMKDVNIAATTALQAIDPMGREKAIKIGANIMMPNITPAKYRSDYKLYDNKPCIAEGADDCAGCMEARVKLAGAEIGYDAWGDSKHFENRKEI